VFSVHGSRLPAPLIVPGAVVEVKDRVDSSGKMVAELDVAAAVERITRMIEEYELDSFALALLWSFVNPAYENALAAVIPRMFMSCSSEVSPARRVRAYGRHHAERLRARWAPSTPNPGPAGGLIGVATLARAYGHDRVIATDMGGASFDLGLVIDGKSAVAEQSVIDQYAYRLPKPGPAFGRGGRRLNRLV
jgi:N-methylhydantoinase A